MYEKPAKGPCTLGSRRTGLPWGAVGRGGDVEAANSSFFVLTRVLAAPAGHLPGSLHPAFGVSGHTLAAEASKARFG